MKNELAKDGKFNGPTLSHMRNEVFGKDMVLHIYKTCDRSERMRNDQGLLDAAAAKRARKNSKRKGN
jgi:hypothetical protein